MAGEEKVGRCVWLGKISSCVMIVRRGWSKFSQWGICPFVTRKIRLTHGANFSTDRKEYRSSYNVEHNQLPESRLFLREHCSSYMETLDEKLILLPSARNYSTWISLSPPGFGSWLQFLLSVTFGVWEEIQIHYIEYSRGNIYIWYRTYTSCTCKIFYYILHIRQSLNLID